MTDIIIIGAGPAGISAAMYAKRAGMDVTVVANGIGALEKASLIENYYGTGAPISGRELYDQGIQGAKALGVGIIQDEVVYLGMDESLTGFVIHMASGNILKSKAVILAAGSTRKMPPVKGLKELEGRGVSYCAICDGFFYRQKKVGVLGAGDYAGSEAQVLSPLAGELHIFTDGKEPAFQPIEGAIIHREKVDAVIGEERVSGIRLANDSEVPLDGVFVAYGTAGSNDLAKKAGAMISAQGNIQVDENMSTNIPGLFAAGDCTGGLLQVAKAVYDGARAGLAAVKYIRRGNGNDSR